MIRPLRQRHRRIVIALAIFLPVAFVMGIVARRPVPEVKSLPKELVSIAAQFESLEWQHTDLFTKSPMQVRLLREHRGAGKFAVKFSTTRDFVKPDLIVYWAVGNPTITDTLPANATLLGGFTSAALPLPFEAGTNAGVLVLYSLADHEIVDVSRPVQFGDQTR